MRELYDIYPQREGEHPLDYSARLQAEGMRRSMYRQCSIGWHEECSSRLYPDLAGEGCRCECHPYNHKDPSPATPNPRSKP